MTAPLEGSSFEITSIDYDANSVVVEDRQLGLLFSFVGKGGRIKDARIENDYVLVFDYKDGSSSSTPILLP